jgi:DNA modification methylase
MGNIQDYMNKIKEGDCLHLMQELPNQSIDMVLCDLPYGTTRNPWDAIIDLVQLWQEYERIIKHNGVIALMAQGLFTAKLIMSNPSLFKYKIVWIKSQATNFLNAKKQPLRKHEDICIFYKAQPTYHPQKAKGEPYSTMRKEGNIGCYNAFKSYRSTDTSGLRYPQDILTFDEEYLDDYIIVKNAQTEGKGISVHPTQKPVTLGRYLIKTYTNEGDIVLDNACGSGSFLVASVLENRRFIGMEKNEKAFQHKVKSIDFIQIANKRVEDAKNQKQQKLFNN